MIRDFKYLLVKHGNEGSRQIFEDICSRAIMLEYEDAHNVECNPGDEGIDVFVGEYGGEMDVYQCKCFFDEIGASQVKQINKSFSRAKNSKKYTLKDWYLCIPKSLTNDEHEWWTKWKNSKKNKYGVGIELLDSIKLLELIKKHNLHLDVFDELEIQKLDEILEFLKGKREGLKELLDTPEELILTDKLFSLKLKSANIIEYEDIFNKQYFNAEILTKEVQSRGIEKEINELRALKFAIQDVWLTQYLRYKDYNDGNELLGNVNNRIEDLNNEEILRTNLSISSSEKKGILHQLADECHVGWVKDYKNKLKKYIEENK